MNPHGYHELRDGTSVIMLHRDPIVESTALGHRSIELQSKNARQLSGFPKWRKLTAPELYSWAAILSNAENEDLKQMRFDLLSEAAEMGHAVAQLELAFCYFNGAGVDQDATHALAWAMRSADAGNASGAYTAYYWLLNSKGASSHSDRLASSFLVKAARLGNPLAQAQLGYKLTGLEPGDRKLVKKDIETAKKWLTIAAQHPLNDKSSVTEKRGKALALFYLGAMFGRGVGFPKNELESLAHYYLSKGVYTFEGSFGYVDKHIKHREANMTSSARQYSQMRAQELRPIYFEQKVASTSAPPSDQPSIGFGSGVFVTQQGHLLTAAHVVENAAKVKARVNEENLEAEIIAIDHPNDVALLKVNTKVDAAPVRSSAGVELGNDVFTIGFPNMLLQGTEPKFTEGTISSTSGMRDDPRQFQVSVQVQPGNSGGALFDENGNVVGLVVARLDDDATSQLTGSLPQNVNYAVKSSYALPLLESLKAEMMAEHSRSWFGSNRDKVVNRAKKASVPLIVELKPPRQ
jgi:S1-C subfamily serine protease